MSTSSRAVYIGGPSHGEIVGGDFDTGETEVIVGPQPVWWDWREKFDHKYRPTGTLAAGMAVYEYVGTSDRPAEYGQPEAINVGKDVTAQLFWNSETDYFVRVGDLDRHGFVETWSVDRAGDFFHSLLDRGYIVIKPVEGTSAWVVRKR